MADIAVAQTGNWSATTTWVGGVLPGENDVAVIVGNYIVTIDQDITCQAIRKDNTNLTAYFLINSSRIINCNVVGQASNSAVYALLIANSIANVVINGDVVSTGCAGVGLTSANSLIINGDINVGSASGITKVTTVNVGTITITGNLNGSPTGLWVWCISDVYASAIIINGNVYCNMGAGISSNNGTLVLNGDLHGSNSEEFEALPGIMSYSTLITVNGNIYGGNGQNNGVVIPLQNLGYINGKIIMGTDGFFPVSGQFKLERKPANTIEIPNENGVAIVYSPPLPPTYEVLVSGSLSGLGLAGG